MFQDIRDIHNAWTFESRADVQKTVTIWWFHGKKPKRFRDWKRLSGCTQDDMYVYGKS